MLIRVASGVPTPGDSGGGTPERKPYRDEEYHGDCGYRAGAKLFDDWFDPTAKAVRERVRGGVEAITKE